MIAECNPNKTDFNYVWRCSAARAERGQTIPMREGDYLFVCVDADGTAHFRYRKKDWRKNAEPCEETRTNAALWDKATGKFDEKSGMLSGHLGGERKFEMRIAAKGNGFTIHCRHFVNPEEGEWNGDDGWGGQQQ